MNSRNEAKRHYVLVGDREVHYRRAGTGAPVVLLHESPLSSVMYAPIAERLADRFTAIAPDTPGYGNSDPLPIDAPSITDYADALGETLDALGIGRCGLYGAHTGACIALEFAVRQPQRVASLVLDGLMLFTAEERRDHLEHYCPTLEPDVGGSHLVRAWTMRRDMYLFFPWFDRSAEASLELELADPTSLQLGMLEYLRAGSGYHHGYHAAFRYEALASMRMVTMPTALLAAETDVLFAQLARFPDDLPANVSIGARPSELDAAVEVLALHLTPVVREESAPPAPRQLPRPGRLTRSYASTDHGQLHLRQQAGGPGRPLLLVHGSPVSAAMLEPLMRRLARSRPVYAFDTFGNGDSDKPDPHGHSRFAAPEIPDFAAVLAAAIADIGLEDFDLYGTHTGAAIAVETSLLVPDRVQRLILDGIAMFDAATVAEFLERYFVDLTPRSDGSHLVIAWMCARDSTIWFPWYRRDPAHRYRTQVYDAAALQSYVLEFLKSGATYPLPYRAAFTYQAADRLPLLRARTLIVAHPADPLAQFVERAVGLCPAALGAQLPDDPDQIALLYERFLDEKNFHRAS